MWSLDSVTSYQDRFVSFDWKMVRFGDLTEEQLRAIEEEERFTRALAYKFWQEAVSDTVNSIVTSH